MLRNTISASGAWPETSSGSFPVETELTKRAVNSPYMAEACGYPAGLVTWSRTPSRRPPTWQLMHLLYAAWTRAGDQLLVN